MEIKYQFFENESLLVQKFSGLFSVEEYVTYTRSTIERLMSKPIKKVLIDFRDLHFGDSSDKMPNDFYGNFEKVAAFRKKINQNELQNKDVMVVFWVDNPLPALTAHLFTSNFPNKNYTYCFTKDNVMKTLQLSGQINLENITRNLDNTL